MSKKVTSTVKYLGNLRTECKHASGAIIQTDAPLDNHGRGENFSPTDLLATSLASCFLTIVGIYCETAKIPFTHAEVQVKKTMGTAPRRVTAVDLIFDFSGNGWDESVLNKIIKAGKTCPVAVTLDNNVVIDYQFTL